MRTCEARIAVFADWERAAVAGYIAGGMRPEAAAAIVALASENVSPLVTSELNGAMLKTFMLSLDLEAGRCVRRHGAALF
jgi:hypothetical protein